MAEGDLFIREVEEGIFCPRGSASPTHDVVYDQDGRLVYESTVPRGKAGDSARATEATGARKIIEPSIARGKVLKDELLFLGTFDLPHFGHWLTEGISRFWPLLHEGVSQRVAWATSLNSRLKRIRYSRIMAGAGASNWRHSLSAFDITRNHLRSISRPTRVDKLLVPTPSMQNRTQIHPLHLDVAQRIGSNLLSGHNLCRSERAVYFSRTRLPSSKRKIVGEERVEAYCRNKGARIVYPEKLELAEQAKIIEEHDLFIGTVGSAFHALMLRNSRRPLKCVYLIAEREGDFPRNWELIDEAMKNQVENIVCLSKKKTGDNSIYLDFPAAVERLAGIF